MLQNANIRNISGSCMDSAKKTNIGEMKWYDKLKHSTKKVKYIPLFTSNGRRQNDFLWL